jgi:hypothetical protein
MCVCALCLISVAAGVLYGVSLPLAARHPLHVIFGVFSALFVSANGNQAGIPGLGWHPKISPNGHRACAAFTPFWTAKIVR